MQGSPLKWTYVAGSSLQVMFWYIHWSSYLYILSSDNFWTHKSTYYQSSTSMLHWNCFHSPKPPEKNKFIWFNPIKECVGFFLFYFLIFCFLRKDFQHKFVNGHVNNKILYDLNSEVILNRASWDVSCCADQVWNKKKKPSRWGTTQCFSKVTPWFSSLWNLQQHLL